ncbi:MAG TPA: septal ring lytic transglycosylase RlpA family protein [Alphaproteobacteria bacterium]|nr:septal ring lytic transglycosylase RlpA family protein [Alphaproteobacteria bacterium]
MRLAASLPAALALGAMVLLSACSMFGGGPASVAPGGQGAPGAHGYYKIGSPYEVDGIWYYPGVDYNYDETGIASWYGPNFHGKYTANGEVYDMNALTAAHPTLPLPSIVRVTDLDNGRSIVVRINDRGPYVPGRIIDLSRRAAQLLGMIGPGTAKVRVQILAPESREAAYLAQRGQIPSAERIVAQVATQPVTTQALPPPPGFTAQKAPTQVVSAQPAPPPASAPPPSPAQTQLADQQVTIVPTHPSSIFVQIGAFTQYENADRLVARLSPIGPAKVTQIDVDGLPFFRVRLGPVANVPAADQLLLRLVHSGYHDARIVVE